MTSGDAFRSAARALSLALLLLPCAPGAAAAENGEWIPLGLEDVTLYAVAVDPGDADVLYVGADREPDFVNDTIRFGGVYKSENAGESWTQVRTGLGDPTQAPPPVITLTIDPRAPQTIYAGTPEAGLFKTTDGGLDWSPSNTGMTGTLAVRALAIDPRDSDVLYVGANFPALYKSIDAGASWTPIDTGFPQEGAPVAAIAIDPNDSRVVYAATWGAGVYKTNDGGESWNPVNTGLGNAANRLAMSLTIDPSNSRRLFAGFASGLGVYRTDDAGATWRAVNDGLPSDVSAEVGALNFVPGGSSSLFSGNTDGGVFETDDGGDRWSSTGLDETVTGLAIEGENPSRVYASTYAGVFVMETTASSDGGGCAASNDGKATLPLAGLALLAAAARAAPRRREAR